MPQSKDPSLTNLRSASLPGTPFVSCDNSPSAKAESSQATIRDVRHPHQSRFLQAGMDRHRTAKRHRQRYGQMPDPNRLVTV